MLGSLLSSLKETSIEEEFVEFADVVGVRKTR